MYPRLALLLSLILLTVPVLRAQAPAIPLVYEPSSPPPTEGPKEDWSTLALGKSGLPIRETGAVLLSKIDGPGYTRELLRVQWRVGDPIDLYVVRPRNVEKPPVILYLYNYTSGTFVFRDDGWCQRATRNGFAAVGFVSALAGQRFHAPRPMKQWFVSELQEALSTSTHDVQMILDYLDTRGDLDMQRVGMFGQGSGGSIAILSAAADPRIVVLDVIDPWGDWPDWLQGSKQIPENERAAYLKPEFLQKVANLDPVTYLPHLAVKSLRLRQVLDNPITPPAAKDKIAAAAPKPADVTRYPDMAAYQKAWSMGGLSGWLFQHLCPESVTAGKLQ
jgi:hypothetical protein